MNAIPGLQVIGERLTAHRDHISKAITERDTDYIHSETRRQQRRGASHLDFNASDSAERELSSMMWLLDTALPKMKKSVGVVIDSPTPDVIAEALKRVGPRPNTIINGMTSDFERIQKLLPLIVSHNTGVVAILGSPTQSPRSAEERVSIAQQSCDILIKARVPEERIYIDPQVLPLAYDAAQAKGVLDACREIRKRWPAIHIVAGLSNISFNLPQRRLINRTYVAMLLASGVDTLICDPSDKELRKTLLTSQTILGHDEFFATYLDEASQHQG